LTADAKGFRKIASGETKHVAHIALYKLIRGLRTRSNTCLSPTLVWTFQFNST
jgi:hypothetical protein